jgi:acyl-CoA synthetase (AMP-forming)/AMP-acid ligase II
MKNCPEYAEAMFACWHAGLVAVPINAKLHPKELEYILGHSGCRLCFATPDLYPALAGLTVPGLDEASRWAARLGCAVRRADRSGASARPTTRPGCSTPAAPPAGPRA